MRVFAPGQAHSMVDEQDLAGVGSEDERWMRRALALARQAEDAGEVPVGAVLVREGAVLGEGCNGPIGRADPTAHAELLALRDAAIRLGNYRLVGSTLYVTVEPCTMCAGALVHARVARLVFGAPEPRAGAVVSSARVLENPGLNHRPEVAGGVLAAECAELLRRFFAARRQGEASRAGGGRPMPAPAGPEPSIDNS